MDDEKQMEPNEEQRFNDSKPGIFNVGLGIILIGGSFIMGYTIFGVLCFFIGAYLIYNWYKEHKR